MPRTERYAARQPPAEHTEDPVTVLVTGFGPFLERVPRNSSWEIASTLPALIPASPSNPTPIHIHVHHDPIRVAYHPVVDLVPKLLPPLNPLTPEPSIILHIGLAAGRDFYTLEKGSHGRGYGAIPDVDGERFLDQEAESKFPHSLFPPVLRTSFDTDDVLERWRENLPSNSHYAKLSSSSDHQQPLETSNKKIKQDVRLSPDAGNFMCGFIYYNSLAHYFAMDQAFRPVAFLHVPDLSSSPEQLSSGCEVAVALIKALVQSRRVKGVVDGVERVVQGSATASMNVEVEAVKTDVNFA